MLLGNCFLLISALYTDPNKVQANSALIKIGVETLDSYNIANTIRKNMQRELKVEKYKGNNNF